MGVIIKMFKIKILLSVLVGMTLLTQHACASLTLSILDPSMLGSVVFSEGTFESDIIYYAPENYFPGYVSVNDSAEFTRTLYQVKTADIHGTTIYAGRLATVDSIVIGQSGDEIYDWIMTHPTEVPLLENAITSSQVIDYVTVPKYEVGQIVIFGGNRFKLQTVTPYDPQPYIWYGAGSVGLEAVAMAYPGYYQGYHSNDYSTSMLNPTFYIRVVTNSEVSGSNILLWLTDLFWVRDYTSDPITVWSTTLDPLLFKSYIDSEDQSLIAAELDEVLRAVDPSSLNFADSEDDAISAVWTNTDDITANELFAQYASDIGQKSSQFLSATIAQNMTLSCGTDIDLNGGTPLIPQTPATSQTTCTVTTNDQNGYDLQLTNDRGVNNTLYHTTQSTTADGQITDKSRWNPSSPNATTFTGTGLAFGILTSTATKNTAWWGDATTCSDTNQLYAGIPATTAAIMEHTIKTRIAHWHDPYYSPLSNFTNFPAFN